ncbi:polyprenyl synthetase family protein [Deferribacter autotrophicus]|uniref:Polyprenyl synthetase family protein n=1 Tax=Deferribacter autotrophicus TaxID=500465 RepID=A0A5A8F6E2_9BACT|nr:farnesyl diphosphate synthase [Deferribacter autotrophicus]KAA0259160.1 polyprenyl synthetase family protein [Deferribacter autotrophicus]
MSNNFNLKNYIKFFANKVDDWMRNNLVYSNKHTVGLLESMRYSLFAGGKRLRPVLIYSSYGIFESYFDKVTPFAAAVEMLHTYSLIHDDLPAMDDDDLRRGKPTNHIMFGEATAILAGDALLTHAFQVMLDKDLNPDIPENIMIEAAFKLAKHAGFEGMVGGQYADINNEGKPIDEETLSFIHIHKTAKLLSYCCELGAILGFGDETDKKRLHNFGEKIGLAFQIVDDILDITSTTEQLGKNAKSDEKNSKATYPQIFGLDESKKKAKKLIDEAIEEISVYDKAAFPLIEIAKYIIERTN